MTNKTLCSRYCTDIHEVSRGLSATAELVVSVAKRGRQWTENTRTVVCPSFCIRAGHFRRGRVVFVVVHNGDKV